MISRSLLTPRIWIDLPILAERSALEADDAYTRNESGRNQGPGYLYAQLHSVDTSTTLPISIASDEWEPGARLTSSLSSISPSRTSVARTKSST